MLRRQEVAQTVALQAVSYLVQQQSLLQNFLQASGLSLPELKAAVGSPEILAAVFDWLLQDDKLLLDFCEHIEMAPERIWGLRNELPGAPAQQYQSV